MQTRFSSFVESCVNVLIGYFVALASQLVVFPLLGLEVRLSQNITIGVIFTGISLIRSFVIRRLFNTRKFGGRKDA